MLKDPIELEIFKNLFHSIAEEMGAALRRTAFSPNIKERRDYSCAVFDAAGEVIAMGDHMPVHLGSMPMSVRAAIDALTLAPGDVAILNDPFRGGTHLPDITLVAPVYIPFRRDTARSSRHRIHRLDSGTASEAAEKFNFRSSFGKARLQPYRKLPGNETSLQTQASAQQSGAPKKRISYADETASDLCQLSPEMPKRKGPSARQPAFYVASRAHHADVGGAYAGSMGICREIYQEGVRIPPVHLVRGGKMQRDVLALLLNNVRTPQEREGDMNAQLAACHTGAARLQELCHRYGLQKLRHAAAELLDYSEQMMRAFLVRIPPGIYCAEDFLDNDGVTSTPVKIKAALHFPAGKALPRRAARNQKIVTVDFTGSDSQVQGSINAVEAITYSACFYVFRCLLAEEVPATAGLMRPIAVIAPAGSIVNARMPAAVAGGNVETSQRIVDVLLRALAQALPSRIPAGSSGTMNNLTIGGIDPRTQEPFAYYETIAGGMGARPTKNGISGIHTHMTNSLNTPIEALEYAYPFRVTEYSLRRGSGGNSAASLAASKTQPQPAHKNGFIGGDGIIREIEVLTDADVTILADRRTRGPYGLNAGNDGQPGKTEIIRSGGRREALPGKVSVRLRKGERIRIESPGGGGWG